MDDNKDLENRMLELLKNDKFIEAIKIYRQNTNAGLKESKDHVEELMRQHGIAVTPIAPKSGTWILVLAVLFVLIMGIVYLSMAGLPR